MANEDIHPAAGKLFKRYPVNVSEPGELAWVKRCSCRASGVPGLVHIRWENEVFPIPGRVCSGCGAEYAPEPHEPAVPSTAGLLKTCQDKIKQAPHPRWHVRDVLSSEQEWYEVVEIGGPLCQECGELDELRAYPTLQEAQAVALSLAQDSPGHTYEISHHRAVERVAILPDGKTWFWRSRASSASAEERIS